jgi:hypothetical protein
MCIIEPWPITARWRRCEQIRDYAMTMTTTERKKYLSKAVRDYVKWLKDIGVAPDKVERERRDMERLITMPPENGGTPLRLAA